MKKETKKQVLGQQVLTDVKPQTITNKQAEAEIGLSETRLNQELEDFEIAYLNPSEPADQSNDLSGNSIFSNLKKLLSFKNHLSQKPTQTAESLIDTKKETVDILPNTETLIIPKKTSSEINTKPSADKVINEQTTIAPTIDSFDNEEESDQQTTNQSSTLLPVGVPEIPTIDNLTIIHPYTTQNSVVIAWQTPVNIPASSQYDLRYYIAANAWQEASTGELTNPPYPTVDMAECALLTSTLWSQAQAVSSLPQATAGKQEQITVSDLTSDTKYCFALQIKQDQRSSAFSNTASARTLSSDLPNAGWPITFTGVLSQDAYFSREFSPYFLNQDWTIEAGVDMEIEAGVVIKTASSSKIQVFGRLISHSAELNPVIFTADADDFYNGDTNDDGDASEPQDRHWEGIEYLEGGEVQGEVQALYVD